MGAAAQGIAVALLFAFAVTAYAQTPLPDDFNPGAGGRVSALVMQANGKVLVGGQFTTLGGQTRNHLGRLNADGTLDAWFNPGANDYVYSMMQTSDERILVGGTFTTLDGQARNRLGCLNTDGALDSGFSSQASGAVYSLAIQADGNILVGGGFGTLGGQVHSYLGRLNADGTVDSGFKPAANGSVYSVAVQADGKILVGGRFGALVGQTRKNIGRLNADGTLDGGFNPGADFNLASPEGAVHSLVVQADGKVLVGGWFTALGRAGHSYIGRLNPDGTVDNGFNPTADGSVYSVAVQADGKILIGGQFTWLGGQTRNRIARLNENGTLDSGFNPGADNYVYSLALQADGKILAGGDFSTLGGQPRSKVGRLNNTGPATESLSFEWATITWLRGGTSPEVWRTTFDFSTNGTDWATLGDGSRNPGGTGWQKAGVTLPAESLLRARGYVTGGQYNASGWFVETYSRKPGFLSQPVSRTNEAGSLATFSVVAEGTEHLCYQWRKAGFELTDQTNATLSLAGLAASHAGGYSVIVSNVSGATTSTVATLTVNCLLNATATAGGSVNRNPDLPVYPGDSQVALTAEPDAGFGLIRWVGDATGSTNPLTVVMDTNKSITAVFASTVLTLSTQGEGTISKAPDRPFYAVGDSVALAASAGRWHAFTAWLDGTVANPRTVTIGESNAYTAVFAPTTPLETVTIGGVSRLAPVGMPAVVVDGVFIVTPSATARGSALVTLSTTFSGGSLLYTLDGTDPAVSGTLYAGPFTVGKASLLRTIAYTSDFTQSVAGDPVSITILPTLTALTDGGGSVAIEPPAGDYFSNSLAVVTATSAPGWTFLQWLGDAAGTNPVVNLSMTRSKTVRAVFGTALSTATVGGGSVVVSPLSPLYPYGSPVRLTPVPAAGNYHALWANAAAGRTNNPLLFAVTNANPTVTAVFASLSGTLTNALTVIPEGRGEVALSPPGNRYRTNSSVVLQATPELGQAFLGWSGAASGSENPLTVTLNSNKVITASFTKRPWLQGEGGADLLRQEGFRLTLAGEFGTAYQFLSSPDLGTWLPLATVTNTWGTVQFTDPAARTNGQQFYRAQAVE